MNHRQYDNFVKRLRRLRPDNLHIVIPKVNSVVDKMLTTGFSLEKYDQCENPVPSNNLWFQRSHSEQAFEYVEIGFADDGDLAFGLSCGVRSYDNPDNWHLYATLSKRRFGLWRTPDLGDLALSPFKRQTFARDWRLLTNNIDGIVRFLETGEPIDELINVMRFKSFQSRDIQ